MNGDGWPVVYFETWDLAKAAGVERRAGTCFAVPELLAQPLGHFRLSPRYHAEHAGKRPPLCVVCPGWNRWYIDALAWNGTQGHHGDGWQITGDPKDGTLHASPSINFVGRYHGWLQAGRISADCEGRRFDLEGGQV